VVGADAYSPATLEPTHPDLYWYGVHGVELLYTALGPGADSVARTHTDSTDVVVGRWKDGRIGTFRGTRSGRHEYGGTAYGTTANVQLGPYDGYRPLLVEIVRFFRTRKRESIEVEHHVAGIDRDSRIGGVVVEGFCKSILAGLGDNERNGEDRSANIRIGMNGCGRSRQNRNRKENAQEFHRHGVADRKQGRFQPPIQVQDPFSSPAGQARLATSSAAPDSGNRSG
jgi:hypothetical protein